MESGFVRKGAKLLPPAQICAIRNPLGGVETICGTPEEFPDRYRAADPSVRPTAVRLVLIHGADDDIVPVEISREFPLPARIVELPRTDHFALVDPASDVWPEVMREIRALT